MTAILAVAVHAQDIGRLADGLTLDVEASATVGTGDNAPMWLFSNRQGLVSPYANSAYERVMIGRSLECDSLRKWRVGYNLDLTLNQHSLSAFLVHQAYVDVAYGKGLLTIGQKEHTMELCNDRLSSGTQTLGINAMPIPQVRFALDDYWTIPYTRQWLAFKGHIAYGFYTDGNWQKEFTHAANRYVMDQLYHSKAGYIRIHKPESPLSVVLGVEFAAQFGGTSYIDRGDGIKPLKHNTGIESYWHAFFPGGGDEGEGTYANCEGNTLGSWQARVSYDGILDGTVSLFAEKFFEDHSAMFFLDYDGYGTGDEWNKKVGNHWIVYDMKDAMLGLEWKRHTPSYIDNVVFEYLYTKYQSGPVNHDRTPDISDHIAGRDNFYNHHIYTGWTNWGMVCGNPFYLSPVYNDDGSLTVKGNRFIAYHLGIGGTISPSLTYRVLSSWQRGWGTPHVIFPDPRNNFSFLAEATCTDLTFFGKDNWSAKAAIGFDSGSLRGHNFAIQLTVSKHFDLDVRKIF